MNLQKLDQLKEAIYKNDLSMMQQVIRDNPDLINEKKSENPFLVAIYCNNLEAVKFLKKFLKVKIDDLKNKNDSSALFIASFCGYTEVVKYLIDQNVNIDIPNSSKINSLFVASYYGYFDIVQILVENNANINQVNVNGETAIFAASAKGYLDIVKYLYAKSADFSHLNNSGESVLFLAIRFNKIEVVKYLVQNVEKINVNKKNYSGITPLQLSIQLKNFEITRFLIENGAEVDMKNYLGETAISISTQLDDFEITKLLIDQNARLSFQDCETRDPLYIASDNRNIVLALSLVKKMTIDEIKKYQKDEVLKQTASFSDIKKILFLELESKGSGFSINNQEIKDSRKYNSVFDKFKVIENLVVDNDSLVIEEYIEYLNERKEKFNNKIAMLKEKGVQKDKILKYFTDKEIDECSAISEKLNKARKYLDSIKQISVAENKLKNLLDKAVNRIRN